MIELPTCSKCHEGKLVPLSKLDEWIPLKGGKATVPFYVWKCTKCGYTIGPWD